MSFIYHPVTDSKCHIKKWTQGVEIEEAALKQVENMARLPFTHSHIALMPDAHLGKGACVGSVFVTKKALVPAAVGVDGGCGMSAVKTSLTSMDLPTSLANLRSLIESQIPHGRTNDGGPNDRGAWKDLPGIVGTRWNTDFKKGLDKILEKNPKASSKNTANHLGTLGTGNHFIELCLDETDHVWVVLHSGSRGVGNRLATYFIEQAKREMDRWFITLPDPDLSFLPEGTPLFDQYWEAMMWVQRFARANRDIMMDMVLRCLEKHFKTFRTVESVIDCHHNYAEREFHNNQTVFVTRKGAVRARQGDLGIIPGSMGTGSFIVEGLGNKDSFCSCSHGAGRKMSRGQAKKIITLKEHREATAGVECRKDKEVLDESPAAYKDLGAVMKAQEDLVKIKHTLKTILYVKG